MSGGLLFSVIGVLVVCDVVVFEVGVDVVIMKNLLFGLFYSG